MEKLEAVKIVDPFISYELKGSVKPVEKVES